VFGIMDNGEYIFYADESGDHSLTRVDSGYPIFVLSICGFKIGDYCRKVVPAIQGLKFRHFGHDMTILHEREIRKLENDFSVLADTSLYSMFLTDLSEVIAAAPFKIFAVIIDKHQINADLFPDNPYSVSLKHGLEEIYRFLKTRRIEGKRYFFVFERRGNKEDQALELEFRRVADGDNVFREPLPGFSIRFADKRTNSTGMQLADLTARPIGLRYLRPQQQNRSFEIIRPKIYMSGHIRTTRPGVIFGFQA
jgi:hypothetical protein